MTQGKSDTSWNAVHYDERMGFVSRLGKGLVDMLNQQAGERILDLGRGTGDLMYEISLLGADCVGLDSSETMLEKARRKYPGLRFFHADGHTFRLPEEVPFDAVFSNAALHWMNRPEEAVVSIGKCLRSGDV
ncbi:class I SAM-dependent methyltransferase [Paenibacillus sp. P25]|nr:class I SAM-dependent methyltransferase [Paenibacillus sp. P25]